MKATFIVDKECKNSRRYASRDTTFPISSVYVTRPYANNKPTIVVTVQEIADKEEK